MNLPATLSISAAVVALLFALLTLGVSTGPGWRELRTYALAAFLAGVFALTEAVSTLDVRPETLTWASRIGLAVTGLHGAAWYMYTAGRQGRALARHEQIIIGGGLVLGGLALVPGLVLTDEISVRAVPWLGVVYRDAVPAPMAAVVYGYDVLAMLFLIAGYLRRAFAGVPQAGLHVLGLGLLCLAGLHDSVVASLQLPLPYLVGLGSLAATCSIGAAIARRFVDQARRLALASQALRAAQATLVQRERLAALGELAAVIAHEVRNPVAVIFNATASLQRRVPSDEGNQLLGIIDEEAHRLGRIVDELLLFTRPSRDERVAMDVGELVTGAVQAATEAMSLPATRVEIDVAPRMGVVGDEHMLRQALINLVTNALQASPEGAVLVEAHRDEAATTITVSDDGPGVAEECRDKVFQPFFTTRASGTGLGLAIVGRVAREHRGEVVLEQGQAGRYNRFVLRLPSGGRQHSQLAAARQSSARRSAARPAKTPPSP